MFAYESFLDALRRWLRETPGDPMAMTFYGRPDGTTSVMHDSGAMPLLGLLHYMIRSQGCKLVLETGTARGVSAACLASAVAHHDRGKVVTLDPVVFRDREALWALLPPRMQLCIDAHQVDSVTCMSAMLASGEAGTYHAALLDSVHSEGQVWAEWQLASRLVCTGGLILVHDAILSTGTVGAALNRIRADGYDVATLWASSCGHPADAGLGLAVIENRARP